MGSPVIIFKKIVYEHLYALQKLLDICEGFAAEVELFYNTKKTICITVKPKWLKDINPPAYQSHNTLKFAADYNYLGMSISQDLCDDMDINKYIWFIFDIKQHFK